MDEYKFRKDIKIHLYYVIQMHPAYSVKMYYAIALPYILPTATLIGIYSGVREVDYLEQMRMKPAPNQFLKIVFGNYAIGFIVGLTYPVSLPLIAAHCSYSKYVQICDK